jgi:hypothetical protein
MPDPAGHEDGRPYPNAFQALNAYKGNRGRPWMWLDFMVIDQRLAYFCVDAVPPAEREKSLLALLLPKKKVPGYRVALDRAEREGSQVIRVGWRDIRAPAPVLTRTRDGTLRVSYVDGRKAGRWLDRHWPRLRPATKTAGRVPELARENPLSKTLRSRPDANRKDQGLLRVLMRSELATASSFAAFYVDYMEHFVSD